MSKTILTYGTFDLFHIGHLRILQRAAALGNRLLVGVSTDEFNLGKGKQSVIPFGDRSEIVGALRCVDLVIPEESWEQKIEDVHRHNVDVFVMGDDWSGKFDFLQEHCAVMYLPRTPQVSSTQINSGLDAETVSKLKKKGELVRG
jgi:glycerol-3-phosphate cytidylyltransferase